MVVNDDRGSFSLAGRRKREIASSFASEIAEEMADIPERMAVIVMGGIDGEGKIFYALTTPFADFSSMTEGEREKMHMQWRVEVLLEMEERLTKRKKEVVDVRLRRESVIGLIRSPREIIDSFPEKRVTPENCGKIVAKIAIALLEEPEKWITDE